MSSSKQLFKPNNNQVVAKSKGRLQDPPSCTVLSLWLPQGKLSFLEEQRLPCRERGKPADKPRQATTLS